MTKLAESIMLKSTDTVWGVAAWMKIFQHMKTWFYDGTRVLSNVTEALQQLQSGDNHSFQVQWFSCTFFNRG